MNHNNDKHTLLIFDLDGTLIDSKADLALSVNATREFMGLVPLSEELVSSYVGNGAPVLVRKALGPEASEADVERALAYFMQFYHDHMLVNTRLYPGTREALDGFREAGLAMAVLTNKPVRISQGIIDALGLHDHFFRVYGGNSLEQKKPHRMGVDVLIAESGAARDRTMMIGDSYVDIRTARNAAIIACGVTYGFQPESLEVDPPDILVDSMPELADAVLAWTTK
jgi:phosphoglycolate phosphatase